ncbi:DUF4102 domain-containing protein [Stenotrophomonas sp. PA-6-5C]|nr:DUF4102 domain-containing protein [Stenotrophomonas sp. PA-6-5C]
MFSYLIDIEHFFSPMPYYEIQSNRTYLYGKKYGTYSMARPLNRLTARAVQTLTTTGYHADGGGLYLLVKHSGTKSWVLRYRRQWRLREMGLGAVRLLGLQEARAAALEQQKLLAQGKDPIDERRCTRVVGATFGEAVDAYIQSHRKGWKNQAQADQWHQSLRDYGPAREMAVSAVTTSTVMACLSPIWTTKTVTATRVRGRIERVLDWAKVHGMRDGENPARWRGHLESLLPKPSKVSKPKHHAAVGSAERIGHVVPPQILHQRFARRVHPLHDRSAAGGHGCGRPAAGAATLAWAGQFPQLVRAFAQRQEGRVAADPDQRSGGQG